MLSLTFQCSLGAFLAAAIVPPFFALASIPDAPLRTSRWHHRQSSFLLADDIEVEEQTPSLPLIVNDAERYGIHKTAILEIEQNNDVFGFPFFLTSIAVGTPPQPFCMLIDLGYGGMAVRSVKCQDCGRDIFSYNSTASSTAHDADCPVALPAQGHHARGSLFQDDIHLASALLTNATFASIDEFHGENWAYLILEDSCDGVIGLAPPNASAEVYIAPDYRSKDPPPCPNFLHELTYGNTLERDIMILSLPENTSSRGHLMLGMEPSHVDYKIPFSCNNNWSVLEDTWKVDLNTVTLDRRGEGGSALSLDTESVAAVTLNPATALALPAQHVSRIWRHLGAVADPGGDVDGGVIECEDMPLMPNMTLTFGGGTQMELSWQSYTKRVWAGHEPICMVSIERTPWSANIAVLGLRLLREFGLVFDIEKGELGLIRSA